MSRLTPIVLALLCCTAVTFADQVITIDFEDAAIPADITTGWTFFDVDGNGTNITFSSQFSGAFGEILSLDNIAGALEPGGALAATYGDRSLSPFTNPNPPASTAALLIAIEYAPGFGLPGDETVTNVSWAMGDALPSDEDGYRLGVTSDPFINPTFGAPPAEFFTLDPLSMQTDAFGFFGSFDGAVNVENGGISTVTIRAGSSDVGLLDQLHSMYYDNFQFTFAAAPSGSDSPISGLGGDGDGTNTGEVSNPTGGGGKVTGGPTVMPEPGSTSLLVLGAALIGFLRFRRKS